jgi:hypothetical protein
MMFDLGYVKPEEVSQIPRLTKSPSVVVYSPLPEAPVAPDVVLFTCQPRSAMLLNEAANRAGVASGALALGRPTCMALPASLQHGSSQACGPAKSSLQRREIRVEVRYGFDSSEIIFERDVFVGRMSVFVR